MNGSAKAGAQAGTTGEDLNSKYCFEVLNAVDYYEVLGFPKYNEESIIIPEADLRRHYLRRSMKVHPDKNNHPKSTQAFQRVAVAYETLSNEQKRNEYILLLRHRSQGYPYSQHGIFENVNNTHFSVDLNSINLVDAFALFASIVEQSNPNFSQRTREATLFDKAADALLVIDSFTNPPGNVNVGQSTSQSIPSRLQSWSSTLRTVGMITSAVAAFANAGKEDNPDQRRNR